MKWRSRRWSEGVYDTLGDAKAARQAFLKQIEEGTYLPSQLRREADAEFWRQAQAGTITVRDYSETWLETISHDRVEDGEPKKGIVPGTASSYRSTLNRHILPPIGHKPLSSVTQKDVDKLLSNALKESGPSAARNAARTIRALFNHATKDPDSGLQLVPFKVTVKKNKKREPSEIPSPQAVAAIASHMPENLRIGPLLAALCALRPAELLGLQRQDFKHLDTDTPLLRIERQWDQKTSPPSYTAPKRDSVGEVIIPRFLVPQIVEHLDKHVKPGDNSPIFPGRFESTPIGHTAYRRHWDKATEAAGTPHYVLHSLRHLGLTLLAVAGATSAEIMARGRHTDRDAADNYQHALPGRERELTNALADAWEGEK